MRDGVGKMRSSVCIYIYIYVCMNMCACNWLQEILDAGLLVIIGGAS